jgi:hypothetical protein
MEAMTEHLALRSSTELLFNDTRSSDVSNLCRGQSLGSVHESLVVIWFIQRRLQDLPWCSPKRATQISPISVPAAVSEICPLVGTCGCGSATRATRIVVNSIWYLLFTSNSKYNCTDETRKMLAAIRFRTYHLPNSLYRSEILRCKSTNCVYFLNKFKFLRWLFNDALSVEIIQSLWWEN